MLWLLMHSRAQCTHQALTSAYKRQLNLFDAQYFFLFCSFYQILNSQKIRFKTTHFQKLSLDGTPFLLRAIPYPQTSQVFVIYCTPLFQILRAPMKQKALSQQERRICLFLDVAQLVAGENSISTTWKVNCSAVGDPAGWIHPELNSLSNASLHRILGGDI